jgi:hypothetical protein
VTILRRTLDALASGMRPLERLLVGGAALAPLLATPPAGLTAVAHATDDLLGQALDGCSDRSGSPSPEDPGRRLVPAVAAGLPAGGLPAPGPVQARVARSSSPRATTATLAAERPSRPAATLPRRGLRSPLAVLAERVPGGARALATPVVVAAPERGARTRLLGRERPAEAVPTPPRGDPAAPGAGERSGPAPQRRATAVAASTPSSPVASLAVDGGTVRSARPLRLLVGPTSPSERRPPDPPAGQGADPHGRGLPGARGGQLAHLAAWWRDQAEGQHDGASVVATAGAAPSAGRPGEMMPVEAAADPLAGELETVDAFTRLLERVLAAEARRHGIVLEGP